MDGKLSLVVGVRVSPALSQRLQEEFERDPNAVSNLRNIAARAMENGRIPDAFLAGLEARAMQEMVERKDIRST